MHKVSRMVLDPLQCMYCGRGNISDDGEELDVDKFFFLDLERDINWGDHAYLCRTCVDKLAQVAGYVTMDQLEELEEIISQKNKDIHALEAARDSAERRLGTITTGLKVLKVEKTKVAATTRRPTAEKVA